MSPFVLDGSVALAWCFSSQADVYTEKVLRVLTRTFAVVPGIWHYEVANALLVFIRRGNISRAEAVQFLDALDQFDVRSVSDTKKEWKSLLFWMAKNHDLSSYDTAYLYLAMDRGLPLATRDRKLMQAAKIAGVPLFQP